VLIILKYHFLNSLLKIFFQKN